MPLLRAKSLVLRSCREAVGEQEFSLVTEAKMNAGPASDSSPSTFPVPALRPNSVPPLRRSNAVCPATYARHAAILRRWRNASHLLILTFVIISELAYELTLRRYRLRQPATKLVDSDGRFLQ